MDAEIEKGITFGVEKWSKMLKGKGNIAKILEVLNVKENKEPLPFFEDFYEASRPAPHQLIKLSKH